MTKLLIGLLIGVALPFAIDYVLFGDATPCNTITTYEDGSSVQACNVRG